MAAGIVLKELKFVHEMHSDNDNISWTAQEVSYPEDLKFVDEVFFEHKFLTLANFVKPPGSLYGGDSVEFILDGWFRSYSEEPWQESDGTLHDGGADDPAFPVMANLRVELLSTSEKAHKSRLQVAFTFDPKPYGDAREPRLKLHVEGYYKPAGVDGMTISGEVEVSPWGTLDPADGLRFEAPDPGLEGEIEEIL